ncbi:MAG: hypothetical protein IJ069_06915 [Prevotella sp.]|nr:hypothetical protein [Prevotella sp.]
MDKNVIKLVLFSVITLTACSTQQQEELVSNKRELIERVLDQTKAPDIIPAAFFHHFPDKFGPKAVEEHIAFFHETGNDILKVQYETLPPKWEIKTAKDFEKVQELPAVYFEPQLQVIEELAAQLKDSALIIPTVYSPLLILHQAAGVEVDEVIKKNPAAAEPAFEKLAKSIENYIRAARERGADGFYVSSHGGNIEFFGQDSEVWTKYLRKWDKYISEVADSVAPLNILHICGGQYENLDAWADYPGTIINLPEFDVEKLHHAQEVFKRPIFGGLDHRGVLINGTLEEVYAQVDKVLSNGPQNLILGANCTVPDSTASDRLRAVVDYVHSWRQTHKK